MKEREERRRGNQMKGRKLEQEQHHEKKVSVRALGEKSALKECSLVHDTFFFYHEI